MEPRLLDFIASSRVARPCPPMPMHARLKSFFDGHPSVNDVIFEANDSAQAESCLLRRDGRLFLIWDENYARWHRDVLTTLLRLPQQRAEIGCDALIFARAAELLTCAGFSERAYVALHRRNQVLAREIDARPSDASRLKQEILDYILGLQEIFVFYHEIAHIAMKRDPDRRRAYHDMATALIEDETSLPIDRPVMAQDLRRWRLLFVCSDSEAEAHAHDTRRQLQTAFASLRDNPSAREELCCDLLAIDLFMETGFDLSDENPRQCLYAAILMQGQIQAAFNSLKQRCGDPELPMDDILGEIARCTQARMQSRMLHLMAHIQGGPPEAADDLDSVAPFRRLHQQMQALFDEIFVPRLYSILFEEEYAGTPIREGAKRKHVRYGVFGPLTGKETILTLGSGSSRVRVSAVGGRDLHRIVFAGLGWGEPAPDERLEFWIRPV